MRGLLDTSVVIDWDDPDVARALPDEVAISAITVAELAAGPHVTTDAAERAATHAWVLDQGDDFLRASARWRGYPDGTATFYLAPGAVLHYRSTPADYGTDKEFTLLTSDADAPVRVTTLLQLHQVLADRAAGHPAPDDAPADTDLADAPDQPDQPDEVGEPESVTAA